MKQDTLTIKFVWGKEWGDSTVTAQYPDGKTITKTDKDIDLLRLQERLNRILEL